MSDCIFCKIANRELEAAFVYEDEEMVVFHDAGPQAPVHVLMVPKKHIAGTDDLTPEDEALMGHMMCKIKDVAKSLELENGYRVVINCGEDGMQTVPHLHIHILGKRKLTWPPG